MTDEEIQVPAAVLPDPQRPYRVVEIAGRGWWGVAGDERRPFATREEAVEFVELRRADDEWRRSKSG